MRKVKMQGPFLGIKQRRDVLKAIEGRSDELDACLSSSYTSAVKLSSTNPDRISHINDAGKYTNSSMKQDHEREH